MLPTVNVLRKKKKSLNLVIRAAVGILTLQQVNIFFLQLNNITYLF